jgi:hypothetical protein
MNYTAGIDMNYTAGIDVTGGVLMSDEWTSRQWRN